MESRTKNAFMNIGSNFILLIMKSVFAFVTRTVFIYCLGKEALGLNGLFTNILSMLSLAELGVGTAINFSLYEPLAKKDDKKISVLMSFYKKAYRIIGFTVAILGVILIPFLKYLIKDIGSIQNVYVIYVLYLANTVSSYFISYKETLINADQKNYKLAGINTFFLIILNLLQMVVLVIYKKITIYLLVQIVIQFIQKIIINIYITNEYASIDYKSKEKIEQKDLDIIVKNVKAMFFHKIGDYCINGTDNLILSAFISITAVGYYSNYLTLISLLTSFTTLFFNNLISSLGNLIVVENGEKKYDIYKKMDFIGFVMYSFCSVILFNVFNDFISLWIGKNYCLDYLTVIAIVISFYITGLRVAPATIKSASGMYDIDKFTPLIQSGVNLVVSIILVQYIGILGVVLGTIISSIVLPSWQRPYIVYKYILNKPFQIYISNYIKGFFILFISSITALIINSFLPAFSTVLLFIVKSIITGFIYIIIMIIFYKNTDEFKYVIEMSKKILKRS